MTRVVYLTGFGRSGSTVLGQLLGESPGFEYVGELNFFWSDGVLGSRPCGCGLPLRECERWSRVLKRLPGDPQELATEVTALLAETTRLRHGAAMCLPPGRRRFEPQLTRLRQHLADLYRAIADEFDCPVIVDSSKSPVYRTVLAGAPGLQVDTIHLVRDPRAVAASWLVPTREPVGAAALPKLSVTHSALGWLAFNALAGRARRESGRYVLARYEDLMTEPSGQLHRIGSAVGADVGPETVSADGIATLEPTHTVAGNPKRFHTGSVPLRLDNRWQDRLDRRDRTVVTAITSPALHRFGYRLGVERAS